LETKILPLAHNFIIILHLGLACVTTDYHVL